MNESVRESRKTLCAYSSRPRRVVLRFAAAGGGVAEFLKAEGGAAPLPARADRIPDGQPISTTTDTYTEP